MMYGPKGGPKAESAFASQTPSSSSTGTYSLGINLTFKTSGSITALRHWRNAADGPASRFLGLWRTSDQTLLASATSSEAGLPNGWVTTPLPTPVVIAPGDALTVSYDDPGVTFGYSSSISSQAEHITAGANLYGTTLGAYPATTGTTLQNYFVDVVFMLLWPQTLDFLPLKLTGNTTVDASAGYLTISGNLVASTLQTVLPNSPGNYFNWNTLTNMGLYFSLYDCTPPLPGVSRSVYVSLLHYSDQQGNALQLGWQGGPYSGTPLPTDSKTLNVRFLVWGNWTPWMTLLHDDGAGNVAIGGNLAVTGTIATAGHTGLTQTVTLTEGVLTFTNGILTGSTIAS
jgi:hypothetical protein